jgi:N-acetyltransferase 10
VHARFRTEAHSDVVARFNERFLLSLASCQSCLVVDDELNVLPISAHARKIAPVTVGEDDDEGGSGKTAIELTPAQAELAALKETIAHTPLVGALTKLTRTLDQARSIMTCADVLAEKSLRGIVAITAGRGRVRDCLTVLLLAMLYVWAIQWFGFRAFRCLLYRYVRYVEAMGCEACHATANRIPDNAGSQPAP